MSEQLEQQQLGFTCAACGKQFRWKPELAGKSVKCKCTATVTIPAEAGGVAKVKPAAAAAATAPGAAAKPAAMPAQAVRKASAAPGIAGAARAGEVPPRAPAAQIPNRQAAATAPAKPAKAAAAATSTPPPLKKKPAKLEPEPTEEPDNDLAGLFELAADAERATPEEDANPRCPNCRCDLAPGVVLCTACGTDLRTGKRPSAKSAAPVLSAASPVAALAAAGAGEALPWGVRRRAPQDVGANRGFSTENVYFEGGKFRALYLPLVLIFVGLGLSMLSATLLAREAGDGPVTASVVMMITIGMIVIDAVLLFIALILAVRLFDMGFGAVGPALLKIVAIAMGPGAVGAIAGHFAGGGMNGFFVSAIVSMILYYALISVLFDLDLGEVLTLVTLIYLIENLAKPFILIALFTAAAGGVPGVSDDEPADSGIGTSGYEILGDREADEPYEPPPDVWDHDGDGVYESFTPPPTPGGTTGPTTVPADGAGAAVPTGAAPPVPADEAAEEYEDE